MNKKAIKVITILSTIIFCVMMATTCFCTEINPNSIVTNANISTNKLTTAGSKIATIIRTVGVVAAVIILMILGIKYMMGSAEEKAEYKKTMIPYVIGAVVLFGASALASAIVELAKGITTT